MKKLFIPVIFICVVVWSRGQSISDCNGAIPLCTSFYAEDQAPLNTGNIYEWTGVCNLNAESNSVWYTFTVQQAGLLSFIITPNNLNDDYDWALFDITTGGCAGIYQGGPSPEVSCNSYGVLGVNGATGISTANGGFGNSNGPGDLNGPPFNGDLPVVVGNTYALVVMNWSQSLQGYSIDFGQSTASLFDNIPPQITSVTANCANTELVVTFSEPIKVSTVQNNDFSITGPGGTFGVASFTPMQTGAMSSSFILTLSSQIVAAGDYSIQITLLNNQVADQCDNLGTGSFTFTLAQPMTFDPVATTACNGTGGSIALTNINGGQSPYEFFVNGTLQSGLTAQNLNAGNYTVLLSDNGVCDLSVTVTVPDNPISVSFNEPADTLSCLNPTVTLDMAVVSPDQPVSWQWSTSDGHFAGSANVFAAAVDQPGTYTVVATNSQNGCSASASISVIVEEAVQFNPSLLRFPNVVTPNSDNQNDRWSPFLITDPQFDVTTLFTVYSLQVFNRWGNRVFESSGSHKKWDASDVATGLYYYVLSYETNCGGGAKASVEGNIQVLSNR